MNVGTSAGTTEPRYRGWYRVLDSAELPKGAVRTVRLAGRDRVLFRTSTGAIGATDPICPHLGAHLGHGGTVHEDRLRCPFHGFQFGLDGSCRVTEHCLTPPSRARLGVHPVRELLGQIFVFDAERPGAPSFALPELSLEGLTTPRYTTLTFDGHIEDFAENGVDLGHFGAVHRYANVRDVAIRYDGPRVHSRFRFDRANPLGLAPRVITSVFDTVIHGFGCSVTELHVETLDLRMRLLLLATPLETHRVAFTVGLSLRLPKVLARMPREVTDRASAPMVALLLSHVTSDIEQDRAIWAHRARLEQPALAPEDAEIGRFRRFATQFREGHELRPDTTSA
jgi:cholesterol 7-desaturase